MGGNYKGDNQVIEENPRDQMKQSKTQSRAESKEKVYHPTVLVLARLAVAADSKGEGLSMAAEILGKGKRIQAKTDDGIPFTLRVM